MRRSPLILIFLVVFIDLLGFGILIPVLPVFAAKVLSISDTAIGLTVAVFSLVQLIFNPVFGSISDRSGRKPVILICLLLSALSYLIFSFAATFLVLMISRIVAGLGGSSIAVAQAYIADITTRENRSKGMGLIGAAFALGFVFGPLIGGYLAQFGYEVIGYAGAGFSFIAFIFTWLLLPESLQTKSETKERAFLNYRSFMDVIKRPAIGVLVLLFFFTTFSMGNIFGTFSLLGYKIYGLTDLKIGYLFGIMGVFSALSQTFLINLLSKFINEMKIISLGAVLVVISLFGMPFSGSFISLAVVSAVLTLGTGLMIPTVLSLISKVTPDNEQGMVLGLNQSWAALARVFGPLWGGFSFQFLGYQWPFITGGIFMLAIFLYSIFYLSSKVGSRVMDDGIQS